MDIKQKPKGERPPAPPKQTKKDLGKLYVDAIKLINQLEYQNDLMFDCMIQIIDEELGTQERNKIYKKAVERYKNIMGEI
jgi:hypothetical protein